MGRGEQCSPSLKSSGCGVPPPASSGHLFLHGAAHSLLWRHDGLNSGALDPRGPGHNSVLDPVVQRRARDVVVAGAAAVVNVVWGRQWMGWWREIFYYCVKSLPWVGTRRTANKIFVVFCFLHFFVVRRFLTHAKGDLCRACDKKRTANVFYRAKVCSAAFAVYFREKRTAKSLPCVSCPLLCARNALQRPVFPEFSLLIILFKQLINNQENIPTTRI